MARIGNTKTDVITVDTVLTTTTLIVPAINIDIREGLSGVLHIKFKCSTAPGTGKSLTVYGIYSPDTVTWDEAAIAQNKVLGSFALPNDTLDHIVTIQLDGLGVAGNYMRLGLYCDAATNYGVARDVRAWIRKAL